MVPQRLAATRVLLCLIAGIAPRLHTPKTSRVHAALRASITAATPAHVCAYACAPEQTAAAREAHAAVKVVGGSRAHPYVHSRLCEGLHGARRGRPHVRRIKNLPRRPRMCGSTAGAVEHADPALMPQYHRSAGHMLLRLPGRASRTSSILGL